MEIYRKYTERVNGNILIKFQISLRASTTSQGVTDPWFYYTLLQIVIGHVIVNRLD